MKLFWRTPLGLVLALFATTSLVQAEAADAANTSLDREVEHYLENNTGQGGEPSTFRAYWKNGIRMDSGDGNFKLAMGGRIMFDMVWADSDDNVTDGNIENNDVGFRRVRMYFSGSVFKNVVFKLQFDFADGTETDFKDVYVGLKNVGPGTLLFGHQKVPFGMNELTSSKYIAFTERAASSQAFAPARNAGIGYYSTLGEAKRIYLAGGTFFPTSNTNARASGNGGWGFAVRLGWAAINNKDKDMMLWVAVDFAWQNYRIDGNRVRYRSRVDSFGDRQISTGQISDTERDMRYAFEVAFKMKSLHIAAEFFWADVTRTAGNEDPGFSGFYAQIGYFITGESRPFKISQGGWARVKPNANFWAGDGGRGAMEVVLRWDSTDLTDKDIDGGEMDSLSVGFNWYWNAVTRVMFDYVWTDITGGPNVSGDANLNYVIVRWQIDF
ncbi:MAG: OprO/OprP family phosphate-selective porin [Planctomycetota bacterium]|jgi:phosphate-selective porin OprO/OprP